MTQERQDPTVIHGVGGADRMPWVARCGALNVETTTTNLALITCPGCIGKAREKMSTEIKYYRDALALLGDDLAKLDHDDEAPAGIVGALRELDSELATLRLRLSVDAIAQDAAEGASDGS